MAKFAGTWKFVSRHNNEKILDMMGCAAEMQKKIINGMETVNTIFEWNEDTKTLTLSNKEADLDTKVKIKMGEKFPIGPYAPGYNGVVCEMGDDVFKAKMLNPDDEEVGSMETRVEGNKFHSTTKLKEETATTELERVE